MPQRTVSCVRNNLFILRNKWNKTTQYACSADFVHYACLMLLFFFFFFFFLSPVSQLLNKGHRTNVKRHHLCIDRDAVNAARSSHTWILKFKWCLRYLWRTGSAAAVWSDTFMCSFNGETETVQMAKCDLQQVDGRKHDVFCHIGQYWICL